jgi:hypothetical protein
MRLGIAHSEVRNGTVFREKIKFDETANITAETTYHRSKASYQCKRHRKHRIKNTVFISRLCPYVPVPQAFFSSPPNWDPPPPYPQASVSPLLFRERGGGVPIRTRG